MQKNSQPPLKMRPFSEIPQYYRHVRREIVSVVPTDALNILDVGCGAGMLGKALKEQNPRRRIVGIELNDEAFYYAKINIDQVYHADLEPFDPPFSQGEFDCIIFADILEHLKDPWQIARRYASFLKPEGVMVVSIPNIRHLPTLRQIAELGSWKYQDEGILDRTHLRFFTKTDFIELLSQANIVCNSVFYLGGQELHSLRPQEPERIVRMGNFALLNVSEEDFLELCAYQLLFVGIHKPKNNLSSELQTYQVIESLSERQIEEVNGKQDVFGIVTQEQLQQQLQQTQAELELLKSQLKQVQLKEAAAHIPAKFTPKTSVTEPIEYPLIKSVSEGCYRPFWSVMIPTYNGTKYLEQTLRSLLKQDPGPNEMQIEVIDDCSTKDDPEAIIRKIGQDRVLLSRQPHNVGPLANWNTCVKRARGHWVHILHQDDLVMPGFYSCFREALEKEPTVGAAFCRHSYIDEKGDCLFLSLLERETPGILSDWLELVATMQRVQFPSIVVRRSTYEELGGFCSQAGSAADWEMWKRIAAHYPVWYDPQILACFRLHSASESSRLIGTGTNIADVRKAIEISQSYLPNTIANELSSKAREYYALDALNRASKMLNKRDIATVIAQIQEGLKCSDSPTVIRAFASLLTSTGTEALLRSLASLLLSTESDHFLTLMSDGNEPYTQVEFELRDINIIIFPNWKQSEELLYQDLVSVFSSIVLYPEKDRMLLLIDNSEISDEDANLILAGIIINLFQQEELDITKEIEISLVGKLSEMEWKSLLRQIYARIILNNENKQVIKKVRAENIPIFEIEELETQLVANYNMSLDTTLAQIQSLPGDWHTDGALTGDVLQAIVKHVKTRQILHSVETGSGASTLLLSHISNEHRVFSYGCGSNGLSVVKSSPLLNTDTVEFIEGPTQQTLLHYTFTNKLQLALIDGPHGYPFPEMEYYFIYPHLEENAILIVDDIHIPNIHNLFVFLKEDNMFELLEVVGRTAFFIRTDAHLCLVN